jgi:hypothetical protein
MVEILWHRRETMRPTENTNLDLSLREEPVYSPRNPVFPEKAKIGVL